MQPGNSCAKICTHLVNKTGNTGKLCAAWLFSDKSSWFRRICQQISNLINNFTKSCLFSVILRCSFCISKKSFCDQLITCYSGTKYKGFSLGPGLDQGPRSGSQSHIIGIITLNNPQGASGSTFYGCIFLFSMLPCTLTCSVLHGNCIYILVQCTKSLHSVVLDSIYDRTVQYKIYNTMSVTNYITMKWLAL